MPTKKRIQPSHQLSHVLDRNINTLLEVQRQMDRKRNLQDKAADRITAISGSIPFVYLHITWFTGWILINTGFTPLPVFDPFPFGLLTAIVSLEAIFLSMFVLISQNRLSRLADQRSDLDLQINLLTEYEITRVLTIVDAIADHLKLKEGKNKELSELEKDVSPQMILQEMDKRKTKLGIKNSG